MAAERHSARRIAVCGHDRVGSGQHGPEPGEPTSDLRLEPGLLGSPPRRLALPTPAATFSPSSPGLHHPREPLSTSPHLRATLRSRVVWMVPFGDSGFLAGFGEPHGSCREPPWQLHDAGHGRWQLGAQLPTVPGTAGVRGGRCQQGLHAAGGVRPRRLPRRSRLLHRVSRTPKQRLGPREGDVGLCVPRVGGP